MRYRIAIFMVFEQVKPFALLSQNTYEQKIEPYKQRTDVVIYMEFIYIPMGDQMMKQVACPFCPALLSADFRRSQSRPILMFYMRSS